MQHLQDCAEQNRVNNSPNTTPHEHSKSRVFEVLRQEGRETAFEHYAVGCESCDGDADAANEQVEDMEGRRRGSHGEYEAYGSSVTSDLICL